MACDLQRAQALDGDDGSELIRVDQFLPEKDVEQKIIELVRHARLRYQIPEDCSGIEACRRIGLRVVNADLPTETDGSLSYDQRIVLLNRRIRWEPRIEFTLFHEITHYLLEEDGEVIDYYTRVLRSNDSHYKQAIERCCHLGAAEFLLPRVRVRAIIDEYEFSITLIEDVAHRQGASFIATAIQLASCSPVECYVVICNFGVPGNSWTPERKLYVDYAPASRAASAYPLARYTTIPRDHLFYQVWEDRRAASGQTYIPFRSGKFLPCYGEATILGGRVFGLLARQRPPSKQQLPLFAF